AAENGGDNARNDGGDQTGGGARTGTNAEGQRQRQGNNADSDAGHEIVFPRARQLGVIGGSWQQGGGSLHSFHREGAGSVAAPAVVEADSAAGGLTPA